MWPPAATAAAYTPLLLQCHRQSDLIVRPGVRPQPPHGSRRAMCHRGIIGWCCFLLAASIPPQLPAAGGPGSATAAGTESAAASPLASITVPHLTGIFVSLDSVTAARSLQGWIVDLTSMKQIGIEWFAIRAAATGSTPPSSRCALGEFRVFFPPGPAQPSSCFSEEHPGVDTLGTILAAAEHVGLAVHLGLGYPLTSRFPDDMNSTQYYRELASINWEVAQRLWALYGTKYGSLLRGWYTDVEEANTRFELELMNPLVSHYLEPLARDLHNMTAGQSVPTTVWASPYYVGNLTRHSPVDIMTPRFYADWWSQIFEWAPHLDLIAPQDSMGAQGNSFANVSSFLGELAAGSRRMNRRVFSNVELFEVWPRDCQWTPEKGICKGRHPAPFARVKQQMANEAALVDELIAWEWHSCLSPYGTTNASAQLYQQYRAYVGR